jgi:hypothetical protein
LVRKVLWDIIVIIKGFAGYAIKVITGVYPKQIYLQNEELYDLENLYELSSNWKNLRK